MGNLVNPVSMRLGTTIYWNSLWATYQNSSYSFLLSSDFLLYNYLNWFGNSRYFNKFGWVFFLSHYKIIRFLNKIIVIFFLKDYKFYKFMYEFWSLIVRYLRLSKRKNFNSLDLITKAPFYLKKKIEDNANFRYLSWFCSFFLYYKNKFSLNNNKYINTKNDFNFYNTFFILKKYNFFFFIILYNFFIFE